MPKRPVILAVATKAGSIATGTDFAFSIRDVEVNSKVGGIQPLILERTVSPVNESLEPPSVLKESAMTDTKLLIRLRDLHEELAGINVDLKSADEIDDETIDALGQLVTDVSGLIDQAKINNEQGVGVEEQDDLADRIMSFESNHPRVSAFLTQMTDLLAMIGI